MPNETAIGARGRSAPYSAAAFAPAPKRFSM